MRAYEDWVIEAETKGLKISGVILQDQIEELEQSEEALMQRMSTNLKVMRESVAAGLIGERRSLSGLVGGDAVKVESYRKNGASLVGEVMSGAISKALAVAEINACMGKIVAAPTAGSCGVLPAVLLAVEESRQVSEKELLLALFTAAGLGMILAERASVSGAEGGCQAEIGSAAAMAAAAAVELAGGSPRQTADAAAIAMKSMLGLVCDPVGGLVEVPCVKRNATGATIALAAAEMALAGVKSAIPIDEVIDTMGEIGKQMPCSLKETAQGGLAVTPTGRRIRADFL
ncbi:L-serine ammonia-lyase, iron-sulfur-dependent, subunit alpha [Desulfosporosinus sp. BICA1-9]|uniref:L-serine ammonia-lyase, iron-sulfur-dependent, subunit alpha n=1 Tax=Desulfosporosinus sp. BICA1-9 TaxID=1531958 RepID=UPI00054B4077|nr:L-serine ammonia-lyase, iron-sulfur-dependent, subunit alpha [Desulfosporosinus sp. BICA1-9]KJS90493.1 MAG: serine dehydratase [Desulfosporosinus sp. BICA1-9]HBW38421.1 L-serine ammonia-lyase, iron-sulfur-dependent, subunit alpha [Desulfosporosinus sp.]